MPTRVRTPDGKVAVFPDGMSPAQIEAVMRREYPPAAAPGGQFGADVRTRTAGLVGPLTDAIGQARAHPTDLGNAPRILGAVAGMIPNAFGLAPAAGVDQMTRPATRAYNNAFGANADYHDVTDQLMAGAGLLAGPAVEGLMELRGGAAARARAAGRSTAPFRPATSAPPRAAPRPASPPSVAADGNAMRPTGAQGPGMGAASVASPQAGTAGPAPPPASPPGAAPPPQSVSSLTPVEQSAVAKFVRVARPDVNAMTGKATAYSGVGINPTVVDTTGRRGQAVVRALASRPTPAQDAVEAFAEQRRVGLASRMSEQARNIVSSDPRTPDAITKDVVDARTAQAEKDFGPIRPQLITVSPEAANALESPYGRDAIRDAIKRTIDGKEREALQLVYDHINPGTTGMATGSLDGARMTIGQMQDISKALFDRANASNIPQEQHALSAFGKAIRNNARAQSPDYVDALKNFEMASRLAEAPQIGASALSPRAPDQFLSQLETLGGGPPDPEGPLGGTPDTMGVQLARAGFRRAIETASGGGRPGTAQGVAQTLADAPEQQAKNLALLGPEDAGRLQNAMRLERQAVINASNASPGAGSNTFMNQVAGGAVNGELDPGEVAKTAGSVVSAAHGNLLPGAMQILSRYLSSTRAFSDAEAETMATLAIDPSRHQDVLNFIASRAGPDAAKAAAPAMNDVAAAAAAASSAPGAGNAFQPPGAPPSPGP